MDGLDLRLMRVRAGITQYELAQRSGIHPASISEMERGQRPVSDAVVDALSHEMSGVGRERAEDEINLCGYGPGTNFSSETIGGENTLQVSIKKCTPLTP